MVKGQKETRFYLPISW